MKKKIIILSISLACRVPLKAMTLLTPSLFGSFRGYTSHAEKSLHSIRMSPSRVSM